MDTPSPDSGELTTVKQDGAFPRIIKAEPNLLRLPFFALTTKGLRNIGGYECVGTLNRAGKRYDFSFKVTRAIDTTYPGLLSRKLHHALLSIVTQNGLPFDNPVSWSWYDLCHRMNVTRSGRMVEQLKNALDSSASLTIHSRQALWSQSDKRPVSTKNRQTTHLYDRVSYIDDTLPDGSIADTNYLWFSSWYLDNLNANYYTYLDHELWNHLDKQSPIASRLYELSLSKFQGTSLLRINYPTLAQLLPVRPERYLSKAKEQLSRPLEIAAAAGVIQKADWRPRKDKQVAQLHLRPGRRVGGANPAIVSEETIEDLTIKEIKSPESKVEYVLVQDFYTRWGTQDRKPTTNEITQAKELFASYGQRTPKLLTSAVNSMQTEFPKAKRFGAALDYIHEAAKDDNARVARQRRQQREAKKWKEEAKEADLNKQKDALRTAKLNDKWDALSEKRREQIRQKSLAENTILQTRFRKDPSSFIVHEIFLRELEAQQEST